MDTMHDTRSHADLASTRSGRSSIDRSRRVRPRRKLVGDVPYRGKVRPRRAC